MTTPAEGSSAAPAPIVRDVGLVHYYTLGTHTPLPADVGAPTRPKLWLGRFEKHTTADEFPKFSLVTTSVTTLNWTEIAIAGVPLNRQGTIDVQVWRANDSQLLLRLSHQHSGDVESICAVLENICHNRDQLTIKGLSPAAWVEGELEVGPKTVYLAQDVVQFVIVPRPTTSVPAPTLGERAKIIRREFTFASNNPLDDYRSPTELNRPEAEYAGHGRGVVLLGGHPDDDVNAIQLTALHLVLGVSRLRMMRAAIKEPLREMKGGTKTQTLAGLRDLSETLRQNLITMSVDVSDWLDGVWMPEIVLDGFRKSFAETLDAHALRDSTQQLLTSLSTVVETYRREFELKETQLREDAAQQRQATQEKWQRFVATLSALLIPPAILISFFGVSSRETVPEGRSIFDVLYYWPAWTLTVVVMVAIFVFAWGLPPKFRLGRRRKAP